MLSAYSKVSQFILSRHLIVVSSSQASFRQASSSKKEEIDLLHHSILPTEHFQKSLPRLSVPKLEISLKRYLASQEAFLFESPDKYEKTKNIVEEFATSSGPQLQTQLEAFAKANKHTSYVTDHWFDMYLRDRRPVVLTHQPVLFFQDSQKGSEYNKPEIRATNMIYSAIRLMRSYRAKVLDPDMFHMYPDKSDNSTFRKRMRLLPQVISWYGAYLHKVYPLDMSQMVNLFNSTRIPKPEKDELLSDPTARHLLVIHKGRFYVFDVLDEQDRGVSPEQILANIRYILKQPGSNDPQGMGNITSANRDIWAAARQRLVAMGNQEQLRLVDTAAFALILDDKEFKDDDVEGYVQHYLHGPATSRWFDKSLSLLMSPFGRTAITFEHSWGDGVAVLRFFNDVWKDIDDRPVVTPTSVGGGGKQLPSATVRTIDWKVDQVFTDQYLAPVTREYNEKRANLDFAYCETYLLDKKILKKAKLSPDAMMQLSFQLAYHKIHSSIPATYESCSTSAFKRGRTETVRPATMETVAMTRLINRVGGVQPSNEELLAGLHACSKRHGSLTVQAAMGGGWDRHLMMLKHMASTSGGSVPAIFMDPEYARINEITVSTSTLTTDALLWGAFAAVTPDGYGCGYGIRDVGCGLGATSWKGAPTAKCQAFVDAFAASIAEIAAIIINK